MNINQTINEFLIQSNGLKKHILPKISSRKDLLTYFRINKEFYTKSGVYLIELDDEIIYIGSSGKIKKDKNEILFKTENGFGSRLVRSNFPYSFIGEFLCYDRKKESGNKKDVESYKFKIDLRKIKICFIEIEDMVSPTYIEHKFLQDFINKINKLPLINNQI